MRLIASLVAIGCLTAQAAAFQARGGSATSGTPRISACSLITPDLAAKYNNKEILKYLKADEEPVGAIGTHCEYGRIGLQVNPFGRNSQRTSPGKDWEPLSGVGEAAFFRPLRRTYAELIVWTGPHHFTIQLGVATGSTMETTKAEAIALANAIIPKLR